MPWAFLLPSRAYPDHVFPFMILSQFLCNGYRDVFLSTGRISYLLWKKNATSKSILFMMKLLICHIHFSKDTFGDGEDFFRTWQCGWKCRDGCLAWMDMQNFLLTSRHRGSTPPVENLSVQGNVTLNKFLADQRVRKNVGSFIFKISKRRRIHQILCQRNFITLRNVPWNAFWGIPFQKHSTHKHL